MLLAPPLHVCHRRKLALSALALAALAHAPAYAGSSYVSVGLPGAVVGYAFSVNEKLGLRVDAGTTGSFKRTQNSSGVNFDSTAKYDRFGAFGDYFIFGGGFRITGGLTINKAMLDLKSHFDGSTSVNINGTPLTPTANDYFNARVKFPAVMPYIGIGWGHQAQSNGLGFTADLGVSIGRAKLTTSSNIAQNHPGVISDADIAAKSEELRQNVGDIVVLPAGSVGLNYRY